MKQPFVALAVILALGGGTSVARGQDATSQRVLNLAFEPDGRVSLSARNVTVREILFEWARQCGCYIVNADKMPGGPLQFPLLFQHQAQEKVLESLLRPAAGFVLTPQRVGNQSRSDFETIYILASSSAAATGYVATVSTPIVTSMPTAGSPNDELPPVSPMLPPGTPAGSAVITPAAPPAVQPIPGMPSAPIVPGQGTPAAAPGMPTQQPTSRVPGPSTPFVPIVPIVTSPAPSSGPAPGTVVPITPGR